MEFFFNPKAIAVVGASRDPTRIGHRTLTNVATGFSGPVYPVNPNCEEIAGLTCYPSVSHIPGPVDLAIVFVPAPMVPQVIRECAERGIPGAMIESAGFAEVGKEGEALQDELKQIAEETGIRLWGPNCMGLIDAVHKRVFSFVVRSIWEEGCLAGDVSLIVQSGFLAAGFLVDLMSHGGIGISKACSIGNKVDVDECDLLEWLIEDANTNTIGLYLESIPKGRRFVDLCRLSSKPIVVLKGGKSAVGAQAALSHTASLAGHGGVVSGALAQAGVVEAHDFRQMIDMCRTLARYPRVPLENRGRVAILTGSGGAGIVSADFVDEVGLELAELSKVTRERLEKIYPKWMPVANPVDLFPAIERTGAEAYRIAFEAVCADPNVDAVLFHLFAIGFLKEGVSILGEIARVARKPVIGWLVGRREAVSEVQEKALDEGIPLFRELYRAVECMAAVLKRKANGSGNGSEISLGEGVELPAKLQEVVEGERGTLDEYLSKQILAATGIPVVTESVVGSREEAVEVALQLGFPVVMKGLYPGKVHKTELGLVHLGIGSAEEAAAKFEDVKGAMGGRGTVVVQKQIRGELEFIVGMVRDLQFGPCVMFGLGGVMAEVLGDSVFAMAPLSRSDAFELMNRLKARKLLDGFRGAPAVDREALAQILIRVGELGCACPRVREIDINPVIVSKGKPVAVDATVILDG